MSTPFGASGRQAPRFRRKLKLRVRIGRTFQSLTFISVVLGLLALGALLFNVVTNGRLLEAMHSFVQTQQVTLALRAFNRGEVVTYVRVAKDDLWENTQAPTLKTGDVLVAFEGAPISRTGDLWERMLTFSNEALQAAELRFVPRTERLFRDGRDGDGIGEIGLDGDAVLPDRPHRRQARVVADFGAQSVNIALQGWELPRRAQRRENRPPPPRRRDLADRNPDGGAADDPGAEPLGADPRRRGLHPPLQPAGTGLSAQPGGFVDRKRWKRSKSSTEMMPERITPAITIQSGTEITVTQTSLRFRSRCAGDEAWVPCNRSPASPCVVSRIGSTTKSTMNQITASRTRAEVTPMAQTSSSSTSVPVKSLGCRNRTGLPWAPILGAPSPSTRAPLACSLSRAARISSTS